MNNYITGTLKYYFFTFALFLSQAKRM